MVRRLCQRLGVRSHAATLYLCSLRETVRFLRVEIPVMCLLFPSQFLARSWTPGSQLRKEAVG